MIRKPSLQGGLFFCQKKNYNKLMASECDRARTPYGSNVVKIFFRFLKQRVST